MMVRGEERMKDRGTARLKRVLRGACPKHGLFMSQVDGWYRPKDGGQDFTIVGCPRRDCGITARAYGSPSEVGYRVEFRKDDDDIAAAERI